MSFDHDGRYAKGPRMRRNAEGHAEEDWIAAEREIDERRAQESGLVQKSYQTLGSAAVVAEKELTQLRSAVADWLGRHSPTGSGCRAAAPYSRTDFNYP